MTIRNPQEYIVRQLWLRKPYRVHLKDLAHIDHYAPGSPYNLLPIPTSPSSHPPDYMKQATALEHYATNPCHHTNSMDYYSTMVSICVSTHREEY